MAPGAHLANARERFLSEQPHLVPRSSTSVARTDTSLGLLFDLSESHAPPLGVSQDPGRAANTSAVTLPRVGVLEPKSKHLWVIHKISNRLSDVARSAIERVQYAALGKDVMPGLHRAATLTLVSFVARNMELPIVLACRGMIEDRSRKTCTEQVVLVNISKPRAAIDVRGAKRLPLGVAEHQELVS
jgi:hypothetical protein